MSTEIPRDLSKGGTPVRDHRLTGRLARILLAGGIALASLGDATAAPAARGVFPYEVHETSLRNGLRLVVIPYDSPGTIAYYTVVRTGSRDDVEAGHTGFAHFFEHMMFRGTAKYPRDRYQDTLKRLGAASNANTAADRTLFTIVGPASGLETLMEMESDRFKNLSYSPEAFRTEALAVLGEYNKDAASPDLPLDQTLYSLLFPNHPYGHDPLGFLADVKAMPGYYDYSRQFFARYYRPESCIVVIVGDVQPQRAQSLAERWYGDWQPGYRPTAVPALPPQQEERRGRIDWPSPVSPILYLGYRIPAWSWRTVDTAALDIIEELLFNESAPLYQELVADKQWAESLRGLADSRRDPFLFTVVAQVKSDQLLPQVEAAIDRAFAELARKPVDPRRLARVAAHLRNAFVLSLDNPGAVAEHVAHHLSMTGEVQSLNQGFEQYAKVTPADIQRVAGAIFQARNRGVVTLSHAEPGARPAATGAPAASAAAAAAPQGAAQATTAAAAPPVAPATAAPAAAPVAAPAAATPETSSLPSPAASSPATAAAGPGPEVAVVALPSPRSPLVAFRFAFRTGSADDPPGKEGLAALTALMVGNAGTAHRSHAQILDELYPLAAAVRVNTDREVTVFSGAVAADALDTFVALLEESLLAPAFADSDLRRNRERLQAYLVNTLRSENDELLGLEAIQDLIFAGRPYGHPPAGTVAGLRSITLDDVRQFYRAHYTRANLTVGVAGGYADSLIPRLTRDLAALPAGRPEVASLPSPTAPSGRRFTLIEKETGAVGIHFGFPLPVTRKDPDYYALLVANSFLGEHRTRVGRLMIELRELRGLNYGDYSYLEYWANPPFTTRPVPNVPRRQQYFSVWVRPVDPADAQFALRCALYEVQRLHDQGMTQAQFDLAREFVLNYSKLWVQDISSRLGVAMDSRFYDMPYYIDEIAARLKALTVDDVNRAVRKYLSPEAFEAVLVTAGAGKVKDLLERDAPSPKTYPGEQPASVLAADKAIATLAVRPTAVEIVPVARMFEN
jgi:zinc protease